MVCVCYLTFQCLYYIIVFGYPIKHFHKNKEINKKWILYFIFLVLFNILENIILYPLKWVLDSHCSCLFTSIKALFALWFYSSYTNGYLFFDKTMGGHLDNIYIKMNPFCGKIFGLLGVTHNDLYPKDGYDSYQKKEKRN